MTISTKRFLMTVLAGTGLFAVLMTYRSDSSKSTNTFEADLSTYASSSAVFEKSLVQEIEVRATVLPEIQLPEELLTLDEILTVAVEPDILDVDILDVDLPEVAQTPPEVETAFQPTLKDSRWTSNPFTRLNSDAVARVADAETIRFAASKPAKAPDTMDTSPVETTIGTDVDVSEPVSVAEFAQPVPRPAGAVQGMSEVATQQSVQHIEYGKSLARRNATEAAGHEFLGALRVLAESNDATVGGNAYANALRSGLLAMREAEDFKVDDPQRQIIMNVGAIIEGHETQVIEVQEARTMTASEATRRYLEYAGQQLGVCGGQNPVAAEALYCLGKMRAISAQANPDPESMEMTQAIIFHHASLTADPNNFRSANELGVLLARNGQLARAEAYLKTSLRIKQVPQSWANLAKVHQRKGTPQDMQLANLAMGEYQTALHRQSFGTATGPIQWVEPGEFISRSPMENPEAAMAAQTQRSMVVPAGNIEPESKPSFADRIGSIFVPKNDRR